VESSLPDVESTVERLVAVNLLLQVSRSADNRLSGTVQTADASDARAFSGTLELMRVFEELVPATTEEPTHTNTGAAAQEEGERRWIDGIS